MEVIESSTYKIHIDDAKVLNSYIEALNPSKVFLLVDTNTEQYCMYHILELLPLNSVIINIEPGEKYKTIDTASFIWSSLLKNGADRHSLVINLGGGVIGDMGGFCAATYMRGIKFIQMPTTLLSMVDSSVGAKLGVDFNGVKNIIGVFQEPIAVIIDVNFLKSLPYKQLLSGYAEILKHSLIQDSSMWHEQYPIEDLTQVDIQDIVQRNVLIKNKIVMADPKEMGLRKILNFGHTVGHAIETILMDSEKALLHGEAIAIGMVVESYISYLKGYLSLEDVESIKSKIIKLYGNKYKSLPTVESMIDIMKYDKKNRSGVILCSLLNKIGEANYNQEVSEEEIRQAVEWYKK